MRTKLTAASGAAAMVAILGVVAVAYVTVRNQTLGEIDRNLWEQAHDVHLKVSLDPASGYVVSPPRQPGEISGYVQVVDSAGTAAGSNGDAPRLPVSSRDIRIAGAGGGWLRTVNLNGTDLRVLTTPSRFNGVAVQIGLPLTASERQLHTVAWRFLFFAVGGLLLAMLGTWAVARRTLQPVAALTEGAEHITATRDLRLRVPAEGADELRRLASAFNAMLDALDQSLSAQRQLVVDASHELRTPLASLRTNVEVLQQIDRLSPQQRSALLHDIITQLEELTGLVADVVELARDTPDEILSTVHLDELVSNAVDRARRHWPMISFEISTEPVSVNGVVRRLDRAIANLLDNAAKFSTPGSDVSVVLTADGTLTVADRGLGIPDNAIPHVFQRFYRADEARALPGSGLGLAIVQQIVDGHNGSVTLTNRPDGGAIARLKLPVIQAIPTDLEPPPQPQQTRLFEER